jgi:hypothetical protein
MAMLNLSAAAYTAASAGATITLNRSADTTAAVTVAYATADGTATAGTNYTATSGTMSWGAGDVAAKTVMVPVNSGGFTGSKTFKLTLSNPSSGAQLGTPASATVMINGTMPASTGTLALSSATYSPTLASGQTISVARSGGSAGAASVHYATASGTAMAGTDYTAASGTLNWGAGDAAAKTFSIPIASGGAGGKSFTVTLSQATGAQLGTPATATISIAPAVVSSGAMAIKVQGNHFVDASGATLLMRGVNVSGLESVAIQGWDVSDPWGGWKPVWSALQSWKVNVVRFPMNEASWLGYTCVDANGNMVDPDPGKNYRATVEQTVTEANAAGIYVILDLQWTAPGNYCPLGQNPMADADNSPAFWTSVATTFAGNPAVIFELFNEPFLPDNSAGWDQWLNGGPQTKIYSPTQSSVSWTAVGMQALITAIRGTGATNVIFVGGMGYSNDLSGWTTHTPVDPLGQMGAAWHVYSNNGYINVSAGGSAQTMLATVNMTVPVTITEVGDADGPGTTGAFAATILPFGDAKGYSYLGWTWNFWGQSANDLILDSSGTPTIGFGTYFKQHLVCRSTMTNCP